MDVLIVEDENLAAERLATMLTRYDPGIRILERLDSVEDTVQWFRSHASPQLLMLDIHLSDGLSFDIFESVKISCPIIFTTAYDQYAIQAFKVNSIDYLLKPIAFPDVSRAMEKLRRFIPDRAALAPLDYTKLAEAIRRAGQPYKTRFLVRFGDRIQFKNIEEIAYFFADGKIVYLVTADNRRFVIDYTLEQLEDLLDPTLFFRLNRKFTVRLQAVKDIRIYSGSRLKLHLQPPMEGEVIVSRERVAEFKTWLDQ